MTKKAERVKAFCHRVIDYDNKYQEYWYNQQIAEAGEAEPVSHLVELIDRLENSKPTTADLIQAEKIPYCRLMARARGQVWDLIAESPLSPLQRRIMTDRYNRAYKWSKILMRSKLKHKRSLYRIHNEALELMVPAMERLFPDWQVGDE